MATKTKAIRSDSTWGIIGELNASHKDEVLRLLCLDRESEDKQNQAWEGFCALIKNQASMLVSRAEGPLPANVRAELEDISKATEALLEKLDPFKMSAKTYLALPPIDECYLFLKELSVSAKLKSHSFAKLKSDGGERNKYYKEAVSQVYASLESFYRATALIPAEYEQHMSDYISEFIEYCHQFIPRPPNKQTANSAR